MSEEEKRKRDLYKRKRDKWIRIQAVLISVITLLAVVFGFLYYRANQTYYISYDENGAVDYKVYLFENDFFDEEYLGKDQAYVASLIDDIKAEFQYKLDMKADNVEYKYSYRVDTVLEIIDKKSGIALFSPSYASVPEKTLTQNSSNMLVVNEAVSIDYDYYNGIANSFIDEYSLGDTESRLVVTMRVDVLSISDNFAESTKNEYAVAINVPLTSKTLDIKIASSVPDSENKILACDRVVAKNVFKVGTLSAASLDLLLVLVFICFIYATRNRDINYTIKVQKLVSAYKSFIQKITNEFNTEGYQELSVSNFNEMLEIRDTISSPILMSENEDKTCTKFIIPTNTKLLYVYEVKIDGYDEIYGTEDENVSYVEESVGEVIKVQEEPALEETPIEEEALPTVSIVEESENGDNDVESAAFAFGVKCDYSFEAKLCLASEETKDYYRQIAAVANRYGVKISRSWKRERVYLSGNQFASLIFKGSKLGVALALDPKEYVDTKYRPEDLTGVKKYEKTPMLMRLSSSRKSKYTVELLEMMFAKAGLKDSGNSGEYVEIPAKSKLTLVSENLIRFEGSEENVKAAIARIWEKHDKTAVQKATEPVVEVVELIPESLEAPEEIEVNEEALGYVSGVKYDYSFEAKLSLASAETKTYYNDIVSFVKSHGVKISRSWKRERIYLSGNQFANLIFKGSKLCVALALDPKEYADAKYGITDLSGLKKYEKTPTLLKVTSQRKLKYAFELLAVLFKREGIEDKKLSFKEKAIPQKTKQALIKAGLIRKK
ncbi:MAG: hypothetical protein IJW38_02470 [Clostridia bacterium]|nr:hypothetical protein [Clostridia bacterium]